ncbi:nucleoside deaminase [Globicatella sanguinis]|uniref:nucleoside deaminase n=1 Tax=Globicatella sanguinis TaxID=13076 RepID=UPI000825E093|nr:nucleoside deaminase [Globicatella sanguinis]
MISEKDLEYLERCVDLAETALNEGDEPFGSVLVSKEGEILFEDYNHVSGGDSTQHPEFAIARWAAENLSPEERAAATVYTSGEHCPMCSAAHAWVGLGRIVYACSSEQLQAWQKELGVEPSPVKNLAIEDVILDANVDGPAPELAERVKQLHVKSHQK